MLGQEILICDKKENQNYAWLGGIERVIHWEGHEEMF